MNKICLVTGSTSGIGLATAKKLSKDNIVIINDYKVLPRNFIEENFDDKDNVYFCKGDISKNEDVFYIKKRSILDCGGCNSKKNMIY